MSFVLPLHITAATIALLAGFLALFVTKGASLHRRAGMMFFIAMLVMAVCGVVLAAVRGKAPAVNIPVALITIYLVITGFTAVHPVDFGKRWLPQSLLLLAAGIGATDVVFGFQAAAHGGRRQGIPATAFFILGAVALLASALDLRSIRAGGLRGAARLTRHLWRMSAALLLATLSFVSRPSIFPAALRSVPVLLLPVVAVFGSMVYWLWRVRARRPRKASAQPSQTSASAQVAIGTVTGLR
jgi:uncharacterized membrane protein